MLWRSRKPAASIATTSGTQPDRVKQRDVLSPTRGAVTPWRGCVLTGIRAGLRPSASGFSLVSAFAPRPVGRAHGVLGTDRAGPRRLTAYVACLKVEVTTVGGSVP
jgi:hypothetical protein